MAFASAALAAPTANEDFVIAEDAKTYTNAVAAAKLYTDAATNNIPRPDLSEYPTIEDVTNIVRDVAPPPGNYESVSNRAMSAVQQIGPYALSLISVGGGEEIVDGVPCEKGNFGKMLMFRVEYDDVRYMVVMENEEWWLLIDDYSPVKGIVNAFDIGSDDQIITFREDSWSEICKFHAYNSIVARMADIPSTNGLASAAALRVVAQNVTNMIVAATASATNYTDSAIATADTSYPRFTAPTNLNQSVQCLTTAPGGVLSVKIPTNGETKDWIVYAYFGVETPLVLPPAIWWMADEAYTNAIPSNAPTALYFSQVADGIFTLSRQELKSVEIVAP